MYSALNLFLTASLVLHVFICFRFVLVNTDERKCLSTVHPSGVLTGIDQGNAPGMYIGTSVILKIEIIIVLFWFYFSQL